MNTPQDKRISLRLTGYQAAFINHVVIAHLTKLREGSIKPRFSEQDEEDRLCRALHDKTWVLYEQHVQNSAERHSEGKELLTAEA